MQRNGTRLLALCLLAGCMADSTDAPTSDSEALSETSQTLLIGQNSAANLVTQVSQMCLEARSGGWLNQFPCRGEVGINQTWNVQQLGDGTVRIESRQGGCITILNGTHWVGTTTCGSTQSDRFRPTLSSNGYYQFQAVSNGNCLDIYGANPEYGSSLQQVPCVASRPHQLFELRQPTATDYRLISVANGSCVDVTNASQADGATLQTYRCLGQSQLNQVWRIRRDANNHLSNNNFSIISKSSGKCLYADREGAWPPPEWMTVKQSAGWCAGSAWWVAEFFPGEYAFVSTVRTVNLASPGPLYGPMMTRPGSPDSPSYKVDRFRAVPAGSVDTAQDYSACPAIAAHHTATRTIERVGPSSASAYQNSSGNAGCKAYVIDVNNFKSDMAHVTAQGAGSCSTMGIEVVLYKRNAGNTGWTEAGSIWRGPSDGAALGAAFVQSGGTCHIDLNIDGSNAPFLVKGSNYRFAVRAYSSSPPTDGSQLLVLTPLPFTMWSNTRAGVTTFPASYNARTLAGIDRWTMWLSTGKGTNAATLQGDPKYGYEPIKVRGGTGAGAGTKFFSTQDHLLFSRVWDTLPARAAVVEGFLGGESKHVISVSGGRVGGQAVAQLRWEGPVHRLEAFIAANGTVEVRDLQTSSLATAAQNAALSDILGALESDMRAAGVPYSCFLSVASAVTGTVACVIAAWKTPGNTAKLACTNAAVQIGNAVEVCKQAYAESQKREEPAPDVLPKPLSPDPTPDQPDAPPSPTRVYLWQSWSCTKDQDCINGGLPEAACMGNVYADGASAGPFRCSRTCTEYSNGMTVCGRP